jgi:uncharacterized protein (DUF924 family)
LAGPDQNLATAAEIVDFWRAAGPKRWFAKDPAFDAQIRERFEPTRAAASHGGLHAWRDSPTGALALIILLDQFPRNLLRGSADAFATDPMAREIAREALTRGHDHVTPTDLRIFFYLPFSHAEDPADQDLAVALGEALERCGGPSAASASRHRDVIRRFGRFPHRNQVLGRISTEAEEAFLANGGFAG